MSTQTLIQLNLNSNFIDAEGARHIDQALQHNGVIFQLLFHSHQTKLFYIYADTYTTRPRE